jgi:hypothetical protein
VSDNIKTDQQIDNRASAALCAEAGMEWDQAQRLTGILRKGGVLRSAIDVRAVRVQEKVGEYPFVELDFENGRKLAGNLCNDFGPIPTWSNPFLETGGAKP